MGGVSIAATSQALQYSDIGAVEATVSGTGIVRPIVLPLGLNGNIWQAQVVGIPAGDARLISVVARDKNGMARFSGSATVTIVAGQKFTVPVVLYEISPTSFANAAPIIDSFNISSARTEPHGTVTVGIRAHDPDAGDTLVYRLSATCGSYANTEDPLTVWTAPAVPNSCLLTATVSDGHGASVHATATIEVAHSPRGGADITASADLSPIISSISLAPTPLTAGLPVRLNVSAQDPEGQNLTYLWSTDCVGSFDDVNLAYPSFILLAAPASGSCRFSVEVTDVTGGRTTGVLNQSTEAATVERAPVLVVATQTLDQLQPNESSILRVQAVDPQGQSLTFTWSTSDGTLALPVTEAESSEVLFTAPSVLPLATMHVSVLVTNTSGLSTSLTFSFNRAPTISSTSIAPLPLVLGQPANLAVVATDSGGEPLSYAWTSTCSGDFDDVSSPTPRFILSALPESSYCTFTVMVRNNVGGHAVVSVARMADRLPVLGETSLSPREFSTGEPVTLATTATDFDGDSIAFVWSTDCPGSFVDATSSTSTFTLASKPETRQCSFTVLATDSRGGRTVATVVGQVGGAPVIGNMLVSPLPVLAGQPVALSVEVTDPDGDPLSYRWSSDCAGSFNDQTLAGPHFTLTSVPDNNLCTFQVLVSDGRGGQEAGQTQAQAGAVPVDLAPVIYLSSQAWDAVDPGDSILLSVSAYDPEGRPLRYLWTMTDGTLGAVSTSPDTGSSSVLWNAPAVIPNRLMQVTVTVSDPGGLSNSTTLDFVPNGPCAYASDGTTCNDGNPQTSGDACRSRLCVGVPN